MNVFVVHRDPVIAAQMLCDLHIQKMYIESAQLLSSALFLCEVPGVSFDATDWRDRWSSPERSAMHRAYKPTHLGHPCTIWAMRKNNYAWLFSHTIALCDEFEYRFGKQPITRKIVDQLPQFDATAEPSSFCQCMPEKYKCDDPVQAYRAYYMGDKPFASWSKRRPHPSWFTLNN